MASGAGRTSTIPERFQGWDEIAHGGIVSTILDEVMAWSLVDADNWGLTARLTVAFKRPVPLGRPIHVEGWITESRRRVITTAGRMVAAGSGEVLATAEALYVAATDDRKRELKERYGYRDPEDASMSPAAGATAVRERPTSPVTQRAVAFVAQHKPAAEDLGRSLAELTGDPEAFARALNEGLATLADPEYLEGQRRIAPGIGDVDRRSLAADRGRQARLPRVDAGRSHEHWLFVADRLLREPTLEPRWFSFGMLERTIDDEPERTWQLVRRAAREASDWITVDTLAHVVGKGILNEAYRWAELEQLVYSPSRWERRLVGSTIATTPFVDHRRGREPIVAGQRPGPHRPADRRRRAGRPEGTRLGAAQPGPRRPGGRDNAFCDERGGHRRSERTTATAPGSSATPLSKLPDRPRRADQGSTRRDPPPRRGAGDVRARPRRRNASGRACSAGPNPSLR